MKFCPRCESDLKGWPRPKIRWERHVIILISIALYGIFCIYSGMQMQAKFDRQEIATLHDRIKSLKEERTLMIKALLDKETYQRIMGKVPK